MLSSPQPLRHRLRLVDQRLAPRLVGLEDRQQARDPRPRRALREPLERLAEQRDALLVDGAVGPDLGEAERGAGERVRVAVAAGGGRGLRVAPAGGLDVARREGRVGEVEQGRAALGRGCLGAQRERLERLRVVRGGLGVAERRCRLARGVERGLPRRLRVAAGPGGGERVVGDLRGGDVGARVAAHDQGGGDRLVDLAPSRLGERLADRVADDPVREAELPRPVRRDQARGDPAVDRGGRQRARDARRPDEVGDREPARDGADLEHAAGVVAEPLDAPADDLAHPGRDQRARRRRVVGDAVGRQQPHELGHVERVAARAPVHGLGGRQGGLGGQQRAHGLRAEAGELDPLDPRVALDLAQDLRERHLARRVGAGEQHARGRVGADDVRQQPQRGRVGPVQVVEHEQERGVGGGGVEQVGDGVVELQALLLAARAGDRAQQRAERRDRGRRRRAR